MGITTTIAAAVNLITDIAAIKWIGLYAASGSTLIAYIFLFVYRIIDVQKIIKVKVNWVRSGVVLGLMVIESFLCYLRLPVLNILNICLAVTVFLAVNRSFVKTVIKKGKAVIGKRSR